MSMTAPRRQRGRPSGLGSEDTPPTLPTDARCERTHPDLLPTHRRCPMCPPGVAVRPLDAQHFYERADRYPWQGSRFSTLCKAHDNERRRTSYAANAQAQNARTAERRKVAQLNRKQAAIFFTPAQVAIRERKKQELKARKERIAWVKRINLRTYGPRDGIKKLIKARQDMYAQKRRSKSLRTQETHAAQEDTSARQSPEDAWDALRLLRTRNTANDDHHQTD